MKARLNHELVETLASSHAAVRDVYVRWTWILLALRGRTDLDRAVACVEKARQKLPMDRIVWVDLWGHS